MRPSTKHPPKRDYLPLDYTVWVQLEGASPEERPVEVCAVYYLETGLLEIEGVFGETGLECSPQVVATAWAPIEATGYHWAHQILDRESST